MAAFPPITIDGVTSFLSLILATLASLRAASRLEQRICNDGSLGLMKGPPILGPVIIRQQQNNASEVPSIIDGEEDYQSASIKTDRIEEGDSKDDDRPTIEASPLWEHTEAFRRAVLLGSMTDDDISSNSIFSDVTKSEGASINVRGGSEEDLAIAAAVEAGLLIPSAGESFARGGGVLNTKSFQKRHKDDDNNSSSNPLKIVTTWLIREISAPLSAIPAWHGMFRSYRRQKKANKLRKLPKWCLLTQWERLRYLLTGKVTGKIYDPSGLDFDASISGVVQIPNCVVNDANISSSSATKTVRVRAFAPKAFRDLRNKCFRVSEREYARSILNVMDEAMCDVTEENGAEAISYNDDDSTMSQILQEIIGRGRQKQNIIGRTTQQTLPYISFQSNSKGAARAGTFFFFTADGAYMIKTVKKEEAKAFLGMLPRYHQFMSETVNSRNSLLTRIFGMYAVQFPSDTTDNKSSDNVDRWDGGLFSHSHITNDLADDERVYLVMHSVFPAAASAFVTERFDLKGSTVGRECSSEERRSKGANAVLKDLDLKREVDEERNNNNNKYGIYIGRRNKAALMAQLERDIDLLHRCNVLDYSLLVGVADTEDNSVKTTETSNNTRVPKSLQNFFRWLDSPMPFYGAGMTNVYGGDLSSMRGSRRGERVIYYLGIIDFLQPWTVKKRLERDLKGLAGYDKTAISCVAPADYAARFLKFVDSHVT